MFKDNKSYFYSLKNKKIISEDNQDFLSTLNKQENKD
jgi:hypothetical protein